MMHAKLRVNPIRNTTGNALKRAAFVLAVAAAPIYACGQCPVSFGPGVSTGAGVSPYSLAVGDLNGDGILDAVVANFDDLGGSGSVSVSLGIGDGSLGSPVEYEAGSGPHAVVIADLDGDLIPDLAVASFRSGAVTLLRGLPAPARGTFGPAVPLPAGLGASGVVAADFNGDGRLDLAVSLWNENEVRVLLGQGGGMFATAIGYPVASGSNALCVGDFDRDGTSDLAVACYSAGVVSVLRGSGDGSFVPGSSNPVGPHPAGLAAGDLNGDGWLDLVASNIGTTSVSVLLNGPGGVFAAAPVCQVGSEPQSVDIADFNHDGRLDIVASVWSTNHAAVLLGNGDGSFLLAAELPVGPQPTGVRAGDLNADGRADIVAASWATGSVSVLLNTSTFITHDPEPFSTCPVGGATFSVVAAGAGLSYRWQRELSPSSNVWTDLANGSSAGWDGGDGGAMIFGAGSSTLIIVANNAGGGMLSHAHAIRYRCVVMSAACGSVASGPAELTVCPADFNCDGFLDFFDYDAFVIGFEVGDPETDFNGDGFLDFFDYDDYVLGFEGGC